MREKNIYAIMKDGRLLPDSHLLVFKDEKSAILSLMLFSLTHLTRDLKLFKCGELNDDMTTFIFGSNQLEYVCDYHNAVEKYTDLNVIADDDKINISTDYIKNLKETVELGINANHSEEKIEEGENNE